MAGPLVPLRCRSGCPGMFGRAHLEGDSVVEVKCDRCKETTVFRAQPKATRLQPDGQGGFLTMPVDEAILGPAGRTIGKSLGP